nr:TPA_asm: NADH dehydrogenase subunit 6 [Symmetromphalus regularis]
MTSYIVFSLAISFFFILPIMMHPLSVGLCIMLCSLISCLLVGLLSHSWFGFILFLIFVGGLLVMFAYVAALSPNVYFSGSNLILGFSMLWMVVTLSFSKLFFIDSILSSDVFSLSFSFDKSSSGEKLISHSCISIMVGLGIILLLNLLAVVKICYYQQGPLREHFF